MYQHARRHAHTHTHATQHTPHMHTHTQPFHEISAEMHDLSVAANSAPLPQMFTNKCRRQLTAKGYYLIHHRRDLSWLNQAVVFCLSVGTLLGGREPCSAVRCHFEFFQQSQCHALHIRHSWGLSFHPPTHCEPMALPLWLGCHCDLCQHRLFCINHRSLVTSETIVVA